MSLRINDPAPNFTAETTHGTIDFHEWVGDGWAVLFSHPKDFTPVCTTELGYLASLEGEFAKRNWLLITIKNELTETQIDMIKRGIQQKRERKEQ
jgi:alkyl hydroperoxide reductase subunit AhpC